MGEWKTKGVGVKSNKGKEWNRELILANGQRKVFNGSTAMSEWKTGMSEWKYWNESFLKEAQN